MPVVVRGRGVVPRGAAVLAAGGGAVLVARWLGERVNGVDLRIYYGAVRWWWSGHDLYSYPHPYTYPPFAAVCMLPMVLLTQQQALLVTRIAILAVVAVSTGWLVAPVARRHGWPAWFAVGIAVPAAAVLGPVRETLSFGQIGVFLAALVLLDLALLGRGHPWAGLGTGLAAAVKITPAFFILYLLLTRRWRAAATATSVAAVVSLASIAAGPGMWWRYWTDLLWQTGRVGSLGSGRNQSLAGLLTRLQNDDGVHPGTAHPEPVLWLAAAALVLAVALGRARRAWLAGDELAGFTITGLAGGLLSPISWTHHLYWVVPAVLLLVDRAAATRGRTRWGHLVVGAATFALFTSGVIHHYWHWGGHHYDDGPVGVLGENAYVLGCLALLCLTPVRRNWPTTSDEDWHSNVGRSAPTVAV